MSASPASTASGLPEKLCVRDEVLGSGGWSVVQRGDLGGCAVAVKTFNQQALRDVEQRLLQERFLREVEALKSLGVRSPLQTSDESADGFFVQLLGYSKCGGCPGPAADHRFYTILELGEQRLDHWLAQKPASSAQEKLRSFAKIGWSLFSALDHLHSRHLAHLDVKPENIMRFGSCWKLIDLECCMSISNDLISAGDITPLYASPELAAMATAGTKLPVSSAIDIWAAGVVLLDVLVEGSCFAEMKASFDLVDLFEEDEEFSNASWYRWLSSPEPLDFHDLLRDSKSVPLDVQLEGFLQLILAKEPMNRPSARQLRDHRLLAQAAGGRQLVEEVFRSAGGEGKDSMLYSRDMLMGVLVWIGVSTKDANCMLEALCQHAGCNAFTCTSLLEFLYNA